MAFRLLFAECSMHYCSTDVLGYHDGKAKLLGEEQTNIRERRNANRKHLKAGLENADYPQPVLTKSQSSYAMKTTARPAKKIRHGRRRLLPQGEFRQPALQRGVGTGARQLIRDALTRRMPLGFAYTRVELGEPAKMGPAINHTGHGR